jgi:hypothetical protein
MQIDIGDPVPAVTNDGFMVEIETMMGDGDGYRTLAVGPFKRGEQEASLQSLLETLQRMDGKFPRGMSGEDNYDDVLGYYEWFCAVRSIEDLNEYAVELITGDGVKVHQDIIDLSMDHWTEWNMDAIVNGIRPEKLNQFTVFYYDIAGVKHTVQIDP